jgi:hypothetical protein
MKALSIRQPWAWLIVNGHKDVENRTRNLGDHIGPLLIHASASSTAADYKACLIYLRSTPALCHLLAVLPAPHALRIGGIVGQVTVTKKMVNHPVQIYGPDTYLDQSPWYTGDVGYCLKDPKRLPFKACKGRLGFFEVGSYDSNPTR